VKTTEVDTSVASNVATALLIRIQQTKLFITVLYICNVHDITQTLCISVFKPDASDNFREIYSKQYCYEQTGKYTIQ